jgi:hypothetical protein
LLGTTGSGSNNFYDSGSTQSLSETITNLPSSGGTLFVTVNSLINGTWEAKHYTFTESGTPSPAILTAPTSSPLSGSSATFSWTAGSGVTSYEFLLGTTGSGAGNVYDSGVTQNQSATPTTLPTGGGRLFVALKSLIDGSWQTESYTFTEAGTPSPAALTAPTSSPLSGATATFTWSPGSGVTSYQLLLGTTGSGSNNAYSSGETQNQSITLTTVPANGGTLFVTVESLINGTWEAEHSTFTESGTPSPAMLTAPTPGPLAGSTATFSWSSGTGVTAYDLWVGTNGPYSSNLYNSGSTQNLSVTLTNLPTGSGTVYVDLQSLIDGRWTAKTYTFAEAP